jgi:chromosome segregation ATPase
MQAEACGSAYGLVATREAAAGAITRVGRKRLARRHVGLAWSSDRRNDAPQIEGHRLTDDVLTELRAMRSEMQTMRSETQSIRTEMQSVRTEMQTMRTEMQSVGTEMQSMHTEMQTIRAHTDGLPLINRAIGLLQQDVRILKDEMRVNTAMVMRLDGSHANLLDELHAVHQLLIGFGDRIHKLEDARS